MKRVLASIVCVSVLSITGCATKHYEQSPPITSEQSSVMSCNDVNVEIAKVHATQKQIEETGRFDALTVFGILGDFGIGNGIAKQDATKKTDARLNQLEALKLAKCNQPTSGK